MLLLVAGALLLGLRHGVDWDHLAAITDLTSAQADRRRALRVATAYALGHGVVVLGLGTLAILGEPLLPDAVDAAMGRVVGATLVVLAVSVVVGLVRDRHGYRMRSRWMLLGSLATRARSWARARVVEIRHDHPHEHGHGPGGEHGHTHAELRESTRSDRRAARTLVGHRHEHRHVAVMPDDPFAAPGVAAATGVGLLHGVCAETPTQVLVFLAAADVSGVAGGVALLVCFVGGLLASNTAIALVAARGYISAERNFRLYAGIAIANAIVSLVLGAWFLAGREVPALLGG
jgi:hypothetical protein